jgi:hypothetical protein
MKTLVHGLLVTSAMTLLALQVNARADQNITIDFEGLSDGPEFALKHELHGVTFENVVVMTPATVRTSTGHDLTAATSGRSAASTFGAKMRFSAPVVQIKMAVSPSFVSVNLHNERGYHTAHLKAYARDGSLLASAETSVTAAVTEPEHIRNVTPSIIGVSSPLPIAYATIDFDDPWQADGHRLLFDDLTLTVVEQVGLMSPTLQIRRSLGNPIMLLIWDYSGELQRSVDLKTWEPVPRAPRGYSISFDTRSAERVFYRVIR